MAGPLTKPLRNNHLQRTRLSSSPGFRASGFFFLQAVNAGGTSIGFTGQVFVSLLVAIGPPEQARGVQGQKISPFAFPVDAHCGHR